MSKSKEKQIIISDSPIRSLGSRQYGGYAIPWGSPGKRDIYETYWTRNSDLCLAGRMPLTLLFNHGHDPVFRDVPIGRVVDYKMDDRGFFVTQELYTGDMIRSGVDMDNVSPWKRRLMDEFDAYIDEIQELIEGGYLFYSIGARCIDTDEDGHVLYSPLAEISDTNRPANFRLDTKVMPLRAYFDMFTGDQGADRPTIDCSSDTKPDQNKEVAMKGVTFETERLADLFQRGVIDQSEYDDARANENQLAVDAVKRALDNSVTLTDLPAPEPEFMTAPDTIRMADVTDKITEVVKPYADTINTLRSKVDDLETTNKLLNDRLAALEKTPDTPAQRGQQGEPEIVVNTWDAQFDKHYGGGA